MQPDRLRIGLIVATGIGSWYGMQLVHEAGHVLHAWISGGAVVKVDLPLIGFSSTTVQPNPHPHFVTWGGPLWGMTLPVALMMVATARRWRWTFLNRFFAGFCLIANGAYLGVGWLADAGDAADLLRYGSPAWLLTLIGVIALATGLGCWNNLGPHFGFTRQRTARRAAISQED